MTPAFIAAVLAGRKEDAEQHLHVLLPDHWPGDDVRYLELWLKDMSEAKQFAPWRARVITRIGDRTMIGHAGFHGPPNEDGMVEIGYTIFPAYRGKGYATEAARRLLDFARELGAKRFRASVSPDNLPSLAIIRKLSMEQIGEQMDEVDGLELVFERPV
jgi:RimJ/RimL family protein N-acetyltransferase